MRTLILTVLLAMVSFGSLAAPKANNNEQCRAWHVTKAYEAELNRTWWFQGTLNSGYDDVRVSAPDFSYAGHLVLGCTTTVTMKNKRTGKTQKYFSAFTLTKYRTGAKVELKSPITLTPPTMR